MMSILEKGSTYGGMFTCELLTWYEIWMTMHLGSLFCHHGAVCIIGSPDTWSRSAFHGVSSLTCPVYVNLFKKCKAKIVIAIFSGSALFIRVIIYFIKYTFHYQSTFLFLLMPTICTTETQNDGIINAQLRCKTK